MIEPVPEIEQFYRELYPEDDSYKLLWTLSDKRSHWFQDRGKLIKYIRDNPVDIYHGLGTTMIKKSFKHRALNEEIYSIRGFWLDIDIMASIVAHKSDNLPATIEEAIEIANKFLEPTYIIFSGHGIHPYYLFDEHYYIKNQKDRAYIMALLQQFQDAHRKAFPEYKIDYTHDLARVLRCPDSKNHKDPDDIKECKIIQYNKGVTYYVEEVDDAIDFNPNLTPEITGNDNPDKTDNTDKDSNTEKDPETIIDTTGWYGKDYARWFDQRGLVLDRDASISADTYTELVSANPNFLKAYNHASKIAKSDPNIDKNDSDMSGYDMSLTNICLDYGLQEQQIINLLCMHRRRYGIKLTKLNRKDYFARTLITGLNYKNRNLIHQKKSQNKTITDIEKMELRNYLEGLIGCRVEKVIRRQKDPHPVFELQLSDFPQRNIVLGSFSEGIMTQRTFRARIGATGLPIPKSVKPAIWNDEIIPCLQALTVEGEIPLTSTYEGQIQIYVTEFFSDKTIRDSLQEFIDDPSDDPFYHENRVYFKLEALQNYIRTTKNVLIDFNFLTTMLACGFVQQSFKAQNGISFSWWGTPENFHQGVVSQ